MRYEVPDDLSPAERRLVEAALREYMGSAGTRSGSAWAMAARSENGRRPTLGARGNRRGAWGRAEVRSSLRTYPAYPRAVTRP